MDLNDLREKIDIADDELIRSFRHRMALSAQIAEYKKGTWSANIRCRQRT